MVPISSTSMMGGASMVRRVAAWLRTYCYDCEDMLFTNPCYGTVIIDGKAQEREKPLCFRHELERQGMRYALWLL